MNSEIQFQKVLKTIPFNLHYVKSDIKGLSNGVRCTNLRFTYLCLLIENKSVIFWADNETRIR